MLVKVACLCYSGSMDFFKLSFILSQNWWRKQLSNFLVKLSLHLQLAPNFKKEKHK